MNDSSLIEVLLDCKSCGWCDNQCVDEDKYDVLVYCLSIQKECVEILRTVNLILSHDAFLFLKGTTDLFEKLAENVQRNIKNSETNTPKENLKPGCSQIYLISQLLEQSFSNEA